MIFMEDRHFVETNQIAVFKYDVTSDNLYGPKGCKSFILYRVCNIEY